MGKHAIRNTIAVYVNISVFSNVNENFWIYIGNVTTNKIK